jgi:hypothetical protein
MFKNKPRSIIIIASLLAVLALLSAVSAFTGFRGGMPGGGMPGNPPSGGNFQGNAAPPQGRNDTANAPGGNGSPQQMPGGPGGPGGFSAFSIFRTLGIGSQGMGTITAGVALIGIVLLGLSVFGLWRRKRWALNLGMALAVLFLCGAVAGLFGGGGPMLNVLRLALNILQAVASLPVVAMGFLPSVRDLVA